MHGMQHAALHEHFGSLGANRNPASNVAKKPRAETYKTVMCQAWLESNICAFGENCRFAHGERELRPSKIQPKSNNKYKTKLCDKYTTTGVCPYGNRCLFIHPDSQGGKSNAYIRPDKVAEIAYKHVEVERRRLAASGLDPDAMPVSVELPGDGSLPLSMAETPLRPGRLITSMRPGLRPHPSWPLEPFDFFQRTPFFSAPRNENHENIFREILSDLQNVRSISPNMMMESSGMELVRRTPSPVLSEMLGKDCTTPGSRVSGYASGDASPAGSSLIGAQSPLLVGASPISSVLGGTSPFSCDSSAMSLNGDGFDLPVEVDYDAQHMRELEAAFDFLKENNTEDDRKAKSEVEAVACQQSFKCTTKEEIKTANSSVTVAPGTPNYDPFAFAIGTDNLAREMCKNFGRIW